MFGSLFRSAVVIGTIYALSPVKLDATPVSAAASRPADLSAQLVSLAPHVINAAQSAAPAAPTANSRDQIGDLIALGKDLCLANPGLCVQAATSLRSKSEPDKVQQDKITPEKSKSEKPNAERPNAPSLPKTDLQTPPRPASSAKHVEPIKTKQPDALAALIEKTVPHAPAALAKSSR